MNSSSNSKSSNILMGFGLMLIIIMYIINNMGSRTKDNSTYIYGTVLAVNEEAHNMNSNGAYYYDVDGEVILSYYIDGKEYRRNFSYEGANETMIGQKIKMHYYGRKSGDPTDIEIVGHTAYDLSRRKNAPLRNTITIVVIISIIIVYAYVFLKKKRT